MKITVKYLKGRSEIDLPEGSTIDDAIAAGGFPADDIGFGVINGKAVPKDYVLADEDEVTLYPSIVGG
ncbi:MAG: MoaD/ThiS family protein [Firmicutes bacterium]|nr:MoaD/ThiS family protein [Bacillota bacterium]